MKLVHKMNLADFYIHFVCFTRVIDASHDLVLKN